MDQAEDNLLKAAKMLRDYKTGTPRNKLADPRSDRNLRILRGNLNEAIDNYQHMKERA